MNKLAEINVSELESKLREQLELQFQRGMYAASYGLSGAIRDKIDEFNAKKSKKLIDYKTVINDIYKLCTVDLNNPDKGESK